MYSKIIGTKVHVVIDRPLGKPHPNYPEMIYPINYGYIEGVLGGDGEAQDAYVLGVDTPIKTFNGVVIAIVARKNDVETKWVVCEENKMFSKDEIYQIIFFQEQYFDIELIV